MMAWKWRSAASELRWAALTGASLIAMIHAAGAGERRSAENPSGAGVQGDLAALEAPSDPLEAADIIPGDGNAPPFVLVDPRYVQLGARASESTTLEEVSVDGERRAPAPATGQPSSSSRAAGQPPPSGTVGQPPVPYAGGQVGSGTRLGFLGNRSVFKTPFNVTGFTDKLIRDQQAKTIGDVILNDPSVRIDSPPFSERDSYFIRGFSVTNVDTAFDGLFYIANARRSQLEGIERVEILKGPTALLSGGVGRVGGTINLIPKRAYDEPLTRINTFYISDTQFGTHLDVGRRFGTAKEWGVRVNAAYRNGNTPLDNTALEVSNVTVGLDYRGERVRASLDLAHSVQNFTAPTSLFNAAAPGIVIPRAPNNRRNTSNPFEYNDSRYDMIAGRVEYDIFDDTTIYVAGGASKYLENFLTSSYRIINSAGDATNTLAIQPTRLEGRTIEVGLRSQFETGFIGHQFNVSAVEAYSGNFSRGFVPATLGLPPSYPTNIYNPVYLPDGSVPTFRFPRASSRPLFADLTVRSVAVADTLSFANDHLLLTLGGRYQEIDQNSFVTTGPTAGTPSAQYKEGALTPAFALVFTPFDQLSFYGNYIEALVPGPQAPALAANGGAIFPPTISLQKEVGAKYDFGSVGVTASLFEITQPNGFTDPATNIFSVAGQQRNRGLEFTVFGEPFPGLRLVGGIALIDARLVRTAGGAFDGNVATGVPDTAFNLYGEYDLPPWLAPGLTVTGRAIYTSFQFYNLANTQTIPEWTRYDVGLRYVTESSWGKPVVLRAIVENVLDDSYWVTAARGFLAVGAPRTFILSASIDF